MVSIRDVKTVHFFVILFKCYRFFMVLNVSNAAHTPSTNPSLGSGLPLSPIDSFFNQLSQNPPCQITLSEKPYARERYFHILMGYPREAKSDTFESWVYDNALGICESTGHTSLNVAKMLLNPQTLNLTLGEENTGLLLLRLYQFTSQLSTLGSPLEQETAKKINDLIKGFIQEFPNLKVLMDNSLNSISVNQKLAQPLRIASIVR